MSSLGTGKRYPITTDTEPRRSVRRDVIVCLWWGLFIATGFSVWVVGLYLRRGAAPFEKLGTTLWAVILLYFCAAIVVGPFVGLLLPLARANAAGAALVGTVTAIPIYGMAAVMLEGFRGWTLSKALALLVIALLFGVPVGLAYRRMFSDQL
jgi:hypothetical protein